jgi:hypothetical protein
VKTKHTHKWRVYSTALCPPAISVGCACGADGWIGRRDFKQSDWARAFHAPSRSYPLRKGLVPYVHVSKR